MVGQNVSQICYVKCGHYALDSEFKEVCHTIIERRLPDGPKCEL